MKDKVRINGIEHEVEVIGGVRYIDGITVDKWLEKANILELQDICKIGQQALIDEQKGTKPRGYQKMMNDEYLKRNN